MVAAAPVQTVTLDKFIEAWKNQDVEGTVALWSDDFMQTLLPSSLGVPTKSRDTAEMIYGRLTNSLSNWKVGVSCHSKNRS
jgi:hypothetical protein